MFREGRGTVYIALVLFRFIREASEGGASRCLGLLAEVSQITWSNGSCFAVRVLTRIGNIPCY
jgi:hypothetical protein